MQVDGIVRVGDRFDIFTLESLKIETAASEEKYLCTLSTLSSPPLLFLKFLQEGSTLPDFAWQAENESTRYRMRDH